MGAAQCDSRHDGWCTKHDAGVESKCNYCSAPICTNCSANHTANGTPEKALKQCPYFRALYDSHQGLTDWQRATQQVVPSFLSGQSGVHIGVVGASGTGKSSFINAVRGLKASRTGLPPGWAKVGSKECTVEPTKYEFPGGQGRLWIWDLPGGETSNFPAADYVSRFGLPHFSMLIILFKDRLTELGEGILKLMTLPDCTVKYTLVRTCFNASWKGHESVSWDTSPGMTEATKEDKDAAKTAVTIEIKSELSKKIPKVPIEDKLFIVSAVEREGDWKKLMDALAVELREFFSGPLERQIFNTEWERNC